MSSSLILLKTQRVGGRCTLNLLKLKRPPVGVVWELGERVPKQKKHNNKDNVLSRIQLKRTADGRYTFRGNIEAVSKALQHAESLMTQPTGLYEGAVCFIYGKLSPLNVASEEQFIKERFPKAKLVGVENATHGVHNDCEKEFTEILLNFLLE
ncbi:hypothetical protein TNCV_792641 [Trichonephila clavipes]|nr:hypothetical protein TNCV_792641 [Trichonephila clavipes]